MSWNVNPDSSFTFEAIQPIMGAPTLCCYYEGGHILGYEFNLDNFFQVKKAIE